MRLHFLVLTLVLGTSNSAVLAEDAWQALTSPVNTELRGLSVVDQHVAWASGARGTVLRTTDGQHWQQIKVDYADADKLDFRAIKAFDANHAYLMSAGPGQASKLLVTHDAGQHWQLLAQQDTPAGFWNAFNWSSAQDGLLFGDPVDGQFELKLSKDAGLSWQTLRHPALQALPQEGGFAASGTCLNAYGDLRYFVSGGASQSRIFIADIKTANWFHASLPIPAAAPSKGAFSAVFLTPRLGLVVGGDYQQAHLPGVNAARSTDGGHSWQAITLQPQGFYSVVTAIPGNHQIAVAGGLAGISLSQDGGKNWQAISHQGVNTIAFSDATHGWAIGPKGLILKYQGPALDQPQSSSGPSLSQP